MYMRELSVYFILIDMFASVAVLGLKLRIFSVVFSFIDFCFRPEKLSRSERFVKVGSWGGRMMGPRIRRHATAQTVIDLANNLAQSIRQIAVEWKTF